MNTLYANLFSGDQEDIIADIYFEILSRCDKATVNAYCLTCKNIAAFCNSEYWLRLINNQGLPPLLPFRSLYSSLACFYLHIRDDACYVVGTYDCNSIIRATNVFTDIKLAYDHVKTIKLHRMVKQYSQIRDIYKIVMLFNDKPIGVRDREFYTLCDVNDEFTFHRIISTYPKLTSRNCVMIGYESDQGQQDRLIYDPQTITMSPLTDSNLYNNTMTTIDLLVVNSYRQAFGVHKSGSIINTIYYNLWIMVTDQSQYRAILLCDEQQRYIMGIVDISLYPDFEMYVKHGSSYSCIMDRLNSVNATFYKPDQLETVLIKYTR